jgi:hypothetical protein
MDVNSVICGDGTCDIITIRLHWDALGDFDHYTLRPGDALTKKGHAVFTDDDYAKLQAILSDKNSLLEQLEPDHVVSPDRTALDVDDVTAATPISLGNAVVSGAVYTCYTLWHWANGEVVEEIHRKTAAACSQSHLMRFLREGTETLAVFAMDQLAARGIRDQTTVNAVVRRATSSNATTTKAALHYLASTSTDTDADIHYLAIEQLAPAASRQTRTLYLAALSQIPLPPPADYFDRISRWLPQMDTYFEVHLLLTLLEEEDAGSPEAVKHSMMVLENENFLIARRAFWFLDKQSLATSQREKVEAFRAKHEDRL